MADATYAIPSFLGGEISQFAQGRFDKPDYRISLNKCRNAFPVEIGPWARRPGTKFAGTTRNGSPGRVIKFDFQQSTPYTLEFTDGFLRFRNGAAFVTTNDKQTVVAVSSANPAVVHTASATSWATGDTLVFSSPSTPLLENRQFIATTIDSTHFSLRDAVTGANIDGSPLGVISSGATVSRIQELSTPYIGGAWSSIRPVQAETTDILLAPSIAPQALTVPTLPSASQNPIFALAPVTFDDGPYLDPLTNGAQLTPNQQSGIVQLAVSFSTYSSTQAYASRTFVTYSGNNYVSLQDQNVGNTPGSSPAFWSLTSASAAINNGDGFSNADVGRLIRLFSEPALWSSTTSYSNGNLVSYNPSGAPGATTYWSSSVNTNTGTTPGTDITKWSLVTTQGAALWTWGRITSLLNFIPGNVSGVSNIGNMTSGSGLGAAFDGVTGKIEAGCAVYSIGSGGYGSALTANCFVGQNYGGTVATKYAIVSATVFPSVDIALFNFSVSMATNQEVIFTTNVYLFGSNTAPGAWNSGTILGQQQFINTNVFPGRINSNASYLYSPITLKSDDSVTQYKYVWVAVSVGAASTSNAWSNAQISVAISQVEFVEAAGSSSSAAGVNVEVIGQSLLYSSVIRNWRLGVYSNGTGYPTCGCYHEGRLWLGGAIANRFDASVSNGIVGGTVNFAPTDQYGVVSSNSAISYTLNSDGVNPMFWMKPDLQGVVIGTQDGEWLVQAPTTGPIAANNIAARRMTKHGSANIEPARTQHTNIFVKRYARKLMEYFADFFSGKFSAPNLADKAEHLVSAGIAELAFTEAVNPVLWIRDAAGALCGMTYKRDSLSATQPPDYYAWHAHTLGSGRIVESICVGPSVGGDLDTLTMVTSDPADNIRHVELLTDVGDENATLANSWFLDDAVSPSSTSSSVVAVTGAPYGGLTINGLWHLNGQTVQVFAGGLDCGDVGDNKSTFTDFVVSNGSVFVPYGDGVSAGPGRGLFTETFAAANPAIVVGFTYNSDGQLVRPISPADTGARNGPALGKIRRNHRFVMLLNNARGISVGATFDKMFPVKLLLDNGAPISVLSTYSGIAQDPVQDSFSYDGMLCWRVSRPFPANLVAISGNIRTQDQ